MVDRVEATQDSVLGYSQPSLRDFNDLLLRLQDKTGFLRSYSGANLSTNHGNFGPDAPAHDWGDQAQLVHKFLELIRK